jgi:hypothetical protein
MNWVPQPLVDVTDKKPGVDGKFLPPNRVLQRRIPIGSLDTLADPNIGIFDFRDVKPNVVVKIGLESNWKMAAPQ